MGSRLKRADLRAALAHANVRAFLRAIRLGEGTSDDAGYFRVVGSKVGDPPDFTDTSKHPNRVVWIERLKLHSSAAGAYQIIRRTWEALVGRYGFKDFAPDTQDEAAVGLIAGRRALDDVRAGRLAEAIEKCRLEWASLPGSPYGQRTEDYAAVQAEYLKHGGTLAGSTHGGASA